MARLRTKRLLLIVTGGVVCALAIGLWRRVGDGAPPASRPATGQWDSRGARRVSWDGTRVRVSRAGASRVVFETGDNVLEAIWVKPADRSEQLLVLVAEDIQDRQPRASHLYKVDPEANSPHQRLSLASTYNVWDVSTGDVDGDGSEDIALCTYSRTVHDPEFARRFFVYSWDPDGDIYPRWRGSRLGRPYIRALLADVAGDDVCELLSVESASDGGQLLVAYEWNQFGFWGIGQSPVYDAVSAVTPLAGAPGAAKGVRIRAETSDGLGPPTVLELIHGAFRPVSDRVAQNSPGRDPR